MACTSSERSCYVRFRTFVLTCCTSITPLMSMHKAKKKNHYIFSSQFRADQMPGPPREGQLICTR